MHVGCGDDQTALLPCVHGKPLSGPGRARYNAGATRLGVRVRLCVPAGVTSTRRELHFRQGVRRELNPRPIPSEGTALTAELRTPLAV